MFSGPFTGELHGKGVYTFRLDVPVKSMFIVGAVQTVVAVSIHTKQGWALVSPARASSFDASLGQPMLLVTTNAPHKAARRIPRSGIGTPGRQAVSPRVDSLRIPSRSAKRPAGAANRQLHCLA